MSIGPVDVAILHFPGSRFTGEIAPALTALVSNGTIRIIDLRVISKADDGTVTSVEIGGLDADLQPAFSQVTISHSGRLLDDEDVEVSTEGLAPGSSAALIMVENTWAGPLVEAIERSGGELVDQVRLPRDEVLAVLDAAQAPSLTTSR
jgi:hypothetical protein